MKKLRGAGTRVCRHLSISVPVSIAEETDLELVLAGFRLRGWVEEIDCENLGGSRLVRAPM